MTTFIVTHKVKDFNQFKKVFDDNRQLTEKKGIKITGVYNSAEDKNHAIVISEAPSLEVAKAFTTSPDLKAAMEKAGVTSMPEVTFLNKVQ